MTAWQRWSRPASGATSRVAVEVDGRELVLSNLDKVLYPKDGLHQGRRDRLLPAGRAGRCSTHLADRPVTRKRYPNGVDESFFFEKNAPQHRPDWVQTVRASRRRTRPVDYMRLL